MRQESSAVETGAAGFVVAVGRVGQWAEEGNVQVGPVGSLDLEEGTSPEEEDRRIEVEERWGSRGDQREDRSESCPVEEEGSRMEGSEGVVGGPEDLGHRATAAAVVAAGWAEGRRPEDQMAVLEERRVRRGVLRPGRINISVESSSSR